MATKPFKGVIKLDVLPALHFTVNIWSGAKRLRRYCLQH